MKKLFDTDENMEGEDALDWISLILIGLAVVGFLIWFTTDVVIRFLV